MPDVQQVRPRAPRPVAHRVAVALGRASHRAALRLTGSSAALDDARRALAASRRSYRQVVDMSPVGVGVCDHEGRFTQVNPALCALVGREAGDLLGRTSAVFAHPEDRHLVARSSLSATVPAVRSLRKRIVRPDGVVRWVELTAVTNAGADGLAWTVAHMTDVTGQVEAAVALQRGRDDLEAVAEVVRRMHSGDDVRSAVVEAARSIAGATSASLLEAAGPDQLVVTAEAGTDLVGLRVPVREECASGQVWRTGEPRFVRDVGAQPLVAPVLAGLGTVRSALWQPVVVDGAVAAVLCVTWPERLDDLDDRAAQVVRTLATEAAVALDREALIRSLEAMAGTDPLTGLANRRSWDSGLSAAMAHARRTGAPLTMALVDVDRFKAYNDVHGHAAGDVVLRDFAVAARAVVRDVDLLARWGGEEFSLLLRDCALTPDAVVAVDRVRACMPPGTTCSAGLATWDGVETAQQLVRRADAGLYEAKRTGRDRCAAGPVAAPPPAQPADAALTHATATG